MSTAPSVFLMPRTRRDDGRSYAPETGRRPSATGLYAQARTQSPQQPYEPLRPPLAALGGDGASNTCSCSIGRMDPHADQRAVYGLLLERHPRMLTIAKLRDELTGVDVDEALRVLVEDGLATRLGDLIGASRAAVRADQLAL
jgi:hypothetical protein